MLNYIWAFMILVGIAYGALCGNMAEISGGVIDSAKEAVELCITMLGIVGFWTGLMEVAKESGLVGGLTRLLTPVLRFLFPRIPKEHKAFQYISVNFIATGVTLRFSTGQVSPFHKCGRSRRAPPAMRQWANWLL